MSIIPNKNNKKKENKREYGNNSDNYIFYIEILIVNI